MVGSLRAYSSYEEYLDSHLVEEDLYYLKVVFLTFGPHPLQDIESARLILTLGYRSSVKVRSCRGKTEQNPLFAEM